LSRFARRHRGAFVTGSAVVCALLPGIVIATWQAMSATRARRAMGIAFDAARTREAETRSVLKFVQMVRPEWH
jgi:hypothetical protein